MKDIVEYTARDGQTIKLAFEAVRQYLVRGSGTASKQELTFFIGICKSRGLNPFKGDAYLIKYGSDPAAIVTSIDYFRARARAQPDCQGWNSGVLVISKNGELKETSGLVLDGETLVGGWFEAQPKTWHTPCRVEVNLNGYIKKTTQGKITKFWAPENQPTMIAKVAESQGLRKAWPDEFQGIYEESEIIEPDIDMEKTPNGTYEKIANLKEKLKEDPKKLTEETTEPDKQMNWWDEHAHWKWRKGDVFIDLIKIGYGHADKDEDDKLQRDNPGAYNSIYGASDDTKKAVMKAFIGRNSKKLGRNLTEEDWKAISTRDQTSPQNYEKEGSKTEPPKEKSFLDREQEYQAIMDNLRDEFNPKLVTEAREELGYGIGHGPAGIDEAQALYEKCVELKNKF